MKIPTPEKLPPSTPPTSYPPDIKNPSPEFTASTPTSNSTSLGSSSSLPLPQQPTPSLPASPAPPPDGGLQAWTQVLVAHLVSINAWGYLTSFGLFQSYYTSILPPSSASPASISFVGSLQICLSFLLGSVSGRALDAGYLRLCLLLGSILQVAGIIATSFATEYWHFLLSHGICKGLGDGIVFCPAVAVVGTYFQRKRAVAMSIGAAGTATGGLIFPIIARSLMPKVGFAWTVRVMGAVVVVNAAVILCLCRARLTSGGEERPLFEWRAFRERAYSFFCVGMFLNWWAVYFAFFYVSVFAKEKLGIDTATSLTLLLVMNAVGGPGRVICGLVADRWFGPLPTLIPIAFCSAVLFYAWAGVHSLSGLWVFCVLYGLVASAIAGLFPPSCASLSPDLKSIGARTGMCFAVVSLACLTGPPIAGALIQRRGGDYLYAQIFGGSCLVGGTLFLVAAKVAHDRSKQEAHKEASSSASA